MKYKYRLDKNIHHMLIWIRSLAWYKKRTPTLNLPGAISIAVVYPYLIGDVVMATPFFRKLRQIAPQANITFIGANWAKQLLANQNLIDEFICFKNPRAMLGGRAFIDNWQDVLSVLKKARENEFDIVIEPFGNFVANLFMSFLKAKQYVGIGFSNLSKLQTYTVPYVIDAHLVDVLMEIFKSLKTELKSEDYYPQIILSDDQISIGQNFIKQYNLSGKTIIGIHPGASVPSRRWPGFGQTINLLCRENPQIIICLFCGPGDDNFVQNILNQVEAGFQPRVLIVKRDMAQYMALLNICTHVICNDSSCGHISAALGRPVTVLFAQGDPRFIAPRGENTVNIISRDFPCKPCLRNVCPKHTHECFTWITPEIVVQAIQKNLPHPKE